MMNKNHLSLLCDFYELTMANGYFQSGMADQITYFDMFFRRVPDGGGYVIAAGLEQLVEYIRDLHFDEDDIAYLRGRKIFSEEFLSYLREFRFTGDLWAVPEGTPVFPREPLVTVRAPALQAQLIETYLLLTINHQSLIATKASRIVRAAEGRVVLEFGSRRAQGGDGAVVGARAAYIGGAHGTACTLSDALYGVPAGGTMAHSWVQMFEDEYTAFRKYCEIYPENPTLLVDTYDTLRSGIPNAIRVFQEMGIQRCAIRMDSGDLAFLSRRARAMLDEAGLTGCRITVSNALDEWLIRDLLLQGARIDGFGVGEKLITASTVPGPVSQMPRVKLGFSSVSTTPTTSSTAPAKNITSTTGISIRFKKYLYSTIDTTPCASTAKPSMVKSCTKTITSTTRKSTNERSRLLRSWTASLGWLMLLMA